MRSRTCRSSPSAAANSPTEMAYGSAKTKPVTCRAVVKMPLAALETAAVTISGSSINGTISVLLSA